MNLKFAILHAVGACLGVLIPGASVSTTNMTHSIQQTVAELFGEAAAKLALELKLDTTGMSGPDKVFAITRALVETAKAQGFKGDLKLLEAVLVDVAQAAYRKIEPSIDADIMALAHAINSAKLTAVASLIAPAVQSIADAHLTAPEAAPTALAA